MGWGDLQNFLQHPKVEIAWDLWLGTAPVRPFAPGIYHPTKWRAWQDFGTGWSGDIGCHIFDPVWKGLGLQAPLSVSAEVQESWVKSANGAPITGRKENTSPGLFPAMTGLKARNWRSNGLMASIFPPEHIRKLASPDLKEYPPECSMLIGTEGSLLIPLGYPPQLLRRLADRQVLTNRPLPTLKELYPGPELPPS